MPNHKTVKPWSAHHRYEHSVLPDYQDLKQNNIRFSPDFVDEEPEVLNFLQAVWSFPPEVMGFRALTRLLMDNLYSNGKEETFRFSIPMARPTYAKMFTPWEWKDMLLFEPPPPPWQDNVLTLITFMEYM